VGVQQIEESTNGVWEISKLGGHGHMWLFPICGALPDSIMNLSQLKTFRLWECDKLENVPMEFGKLQSLVDMCISSCSQLGCLPDSIMDLSQLKIFRFFRCDKLENLPMEFRKL
jgi:hypothetical protein